MVVLNACKSGRYGGKVGSGYYGVAARIVERTGIPAVIAHQHSILVKVAAPFSEALYRRIAANDPVDVALTEVRLLLQRTPQWATPVLYMSSPDGILFGDGAGTEADAMEQMPLPRTTELQWSRSVSGSSASSASRARLGVMRYAVTPPRRST